MAEVSSSRFTASRAALVAMTRIETACASRAMAAKSATAVAVAAMASGLQAMRLIEAVPEARLFALLATG